MEHHSHYQTSDLALAAFLVASGITLVEIDWQNPYRAIFCFGDPQRAEELAARFLTGEALVSALPYANALSDLKGRLFRERRRRGL